MNFGRQGQDIFWLFMMPYEKGIGEKADFLIPTNGIRPVYRNEVDILLKKFFRHFDIYEQSGPVHDRFLIDPFQCLPSFWEDTEEAVFSTRITPINFIGYHKHNPPGGKYASN